MTRRKEQKLIESRFQVRAGARKPRLPVSYEIKVFDFQAVITAGHDGGKELEAMRWGLVTPFDKDTSRVPHRINARAETLDDKRSYREPFRHRRCVLVVDGFYEPTTLQPSKSRHFIHRNDDDWFLIAGLFEPPSVRGISRDATCTLITTEPNGTIRPLHPRMPAILDEARMDFWLDPENEDRDALREVLAPWPGEDLEHYEVWKFRYVREDSPRCLEPFQEPQGNLELF